MKSNILQFPANPLLYCGASLNNSHPTSQRNVLPEEIQRAAERGWQVFPFFARSTKAIGAAAMRSQATSDLDVLSCWARRFTGCNWALATGEVSGVFVLEFDGHDGRVRFYSSARVNLEADELHVQTLMALAGYGESDKQYAFYRWPSSELYCPRARRLLPGVTAIGEGGFVLLPPSLRMNGMSYVYQNEESEVLAPQLWLLETAFHMTEGGAMSPETKLPPQRATVGNAINRRQSSAV